MTPAILPARSRAMSDFAFEAGSGQRARRNQGGSRTMNWKLIQGGLSRRRFVTLSGTALAASGAATLGGTRFAIGQQARTLRIATGEADGPGATIDPAYSTSDVDATRIALTYERLVVLDTGFAPRPQLAERWEHNDTADEWTFHLHRGVRFHDGEPFTARDVIYTFRRLLDPDVGSPAAASLGAIDPDGIEAIDDHTVRFRLPDPVVEFPSLITNRFCYIVQEGRTAEELRANAIGTGPFRVTHFVPGDEPISFVRNDTYRIDGLPKVDAVELRSIPDQAARLSALQAGLIDLIWDLPHVGLEGLEGDASVNLVTIPTPFYLTRSCWTDTPPCDDVRVRQAMKYCVNREQMLQFTLGGRGNIANDNPVAPWVQYALDAPLREHNIERARELLAEAGHGNGLEIDLHSTTFNHFPELSTMYQAMAAEAGINVNIIQEPPDDYWSRVWLKVPFMCSSWSGRAADDALATPYLSTATWNETHWRNLQFDELIHTARGTIDVAERTRLYQDAQRLLRDDGGAIISVFKEGISATRGNVGGWRPHPQGYHKDFAEVAFTD